MAEEEHGMPAFDLYEEGASLHIKLEEAVRSEAQAGQQHNSANAKVKSLDEEYRLQLKKERDNVVIPWSNSSIIPASTRPRRSKLRLAQKRAIRSLRRSKQSLDKIRAVIRDLRRQVAENRISLQQLEQSTNGIANELHDSGKDHVLLLAADLCMLTHLTASMAALTF